MQDSQDRGRTQETKFGKLPSQNSFQDVCDPSRRRGNPRDTVLMSERKQVCDSVFAAGQFQVLSPGGSDSCWPERSRGHAGLQMVLLG